MEAAKVEAATAKAGPEAGKCAIPPPKTLRNVYFGIRHGQSENNILAIISSDPAIGVPTHALTPLGEGQAAAAGAPLGEALAACKGDWSEVVACSSDFLRAKQTADLCLATLPASVGAVASVELRPELRERWFGTLDTQDVYTYNKVWPCDLEDARSDAGFEVESVEKVVTRLSLLISDLEERHSGKAVCLFSHADTIQILQTWLSGEDVRKFSQFRFKNGEVRRLVPNDPSSLPDPVPITLLV